ncbi:MAG: hypothetical protein Q9167_003744 [Letrouitia subvulpina]
MLFDLSLNHLNGSVPSLNQAFDSSHNYPLSSYSRPEIMMPTSKYEPQSNSAPVRLRRRDLQKTAIQVKVGHEPGSAETFTIHKELICHYSPFFKAALTGSWSEAESGIVNLPSDSTDVFAVFEEWLYSQTLQLEDTQENNVIFLMELHVFGDKVAVPEFQNAAMNALRFAKLNTQKTGLFKVSEIEYAYQHTSAGSPLRQFITDIYVWEANMLVFTDNFAIDSYPMAFVVDVIKGYVTQFPRPKKSSIPKPYVAALEHYMVPTQRREA